MVEGRVGGVEMEEEELGKKWGDLNGKQVVGIKEMGEKIKVIKQGGG